MPLLLLILVPAGFGLNPVIARALADRFEPGTLSLIRWGGAALLIGMIALARGHQERWRMQAPAWVVVLGACGFGFCSFAAYAGVQTTTATTVGLIYASTSAVVALVEIATRVVRPSLPMVAGLMTCILGVAVLLTKGDLASIGSMSIGPGEWWSVAGTIVWAGYTAGMTRLANTQTPFAQFTVMSFAGALASLVPAIVELSTGRGLPPMTGALALWLAVLILIPSCGAFIGYNISIRLNGPVLTAASITLAPVYIAGMAIVLIGEDVTKAHFAAIALVVSGLGLLQWDRLRRERARTRANKPPSKVTSTPLKRAATRPAPTRSP